MKRFNTIILVILFSVSPFFVQGLAGDSLAIAAPVPDTGQNESSTDTFGEDSDYKIHPQSYTKLDDQGNDLPDNAASWTMVRDNVTGLIWEVKTNDQSIHDKLNTYTWQNAQDVFITELNDNNFGGFSDWRLPSAQELHSIVNRSTYNPSIDTRYFPNTGPDPSNFKSTTYWSSTTVADNNINAWCVVFSDGYVNRNIKSDQNYVRAVHGEENGANIFLDNGDGTVTDTSTGLMWQKGSGGAKSWEAAINYCENLTLAGYDDWRLPDINELHSIVDYNRAYPAIDLASFPEAQPSSYWSSTTRANINMSSYVAFRVHFGEGIVGNDGKETISNVRAVRGGQSPHIATISGTPTSPTNSTDALLTVGGTDVVSYKYKLDSGSYSSETSVATQISLSSLVEGSHTISVIGKDTCGNWQLEADATTASWIVDLTPPSGSIAINNGETYCASLDVSLALNTSDAAYMCFSNDGSTFNGWEAYATSKSWTLADGDGTKTVYVKFKDSAGNISTAVSDSIILDIAPVSNGTLTDVTNYGTIDGARLDGDITNNGTITGNIRLTSGTCVDGGVVSGELTGEGDGAVITNALVDVTSISNVTIGPGCMVTQNTINDNPGLDLTGAITDEGGVIRSDVGLFVDASGDEQTVNDLLADAIDDMLADDTTSFSQSLGDGTIIVSSDKLKGMLVPAKVQSVVTTEEGDGIKITQSGELVIINNGIAMTLAPACVNMPSFESALYNNGINGKVKKDGVVIVHLPGPGGGFRLSLRFCNVAEKTASTKKSASESASFSVVGDHSDPESLSIVVTYPDGTKQKMPPFVHDLGQFKEAMGAVNYRIDPSTGVIELLDSDGKSIWKGIPDYFLLDSPDDTTGISFETAGDVNGDGLTDFYMITETGKQIIYTLP